MFGAGAEAGAGAGAGTGGGGGGRDRGRTSSQQRIAWARWFSASVILSQHCARLRLRLTLAASTSFLCSAVQGEAQTCE